MRHNLVFTACLMGVICAMSADAAPPLLPVVETQYQVYELGKPGNGAGPHEFNVPMQDKAFAWLDRWLKK